MKLDVKGRFIKDEDDNGKGYKFSLTFPSLTTLSIWYLLELLFFLGLLFLKYLTYCKKYWIFFDNVFASKDDYEAPKKNGIFY